MRIPSLDGLRAASIVLVLFAHTAGTTRAPDLAWLQAIGDIGHLGVRVFFVISGLLMTILLEREFDLTGRISLAAFLQRRAIRIVPAFGAYVAVIAIAGAAGIVVLRPRDLLMAANVHHELPRGPRVVSGTPLVAVRRGPVLHHLGHREDARRPQRHVLGGRSRSRARSRDSRRRSRACAGVAMGDWRGIPYHHRRARNRRAAGGGAREAGEEPLVRHASCAPELWRWRRSR